MYNIKAIREARGISQAQLAQLTGIKQQQISRYESGNVDTIGLARIVKIAQALEAHPSELYNWENASAQGS